MITPEFAKQFSENWLKDWNAHDLENVLSHYSDDFIVESPLALKRMPETRGIVFGKDNIRKYWREGLDANPDLNFKIIDVLTGISSLTIYYLNTSNGKKSTEMMIFNSNKKVNRVLVSYSE